MQQQKELLLLAIFCLIKPLNTAIKFHQVAGTKCLSASLAVWQKPRPSVSMLDCFQSSRSFGLRSVGVVQRSRRDASCRLFRFGQVCHLLGLMDISSSQLTVSTVKEDCNIVVDSEYDAFIANKRFNGVWVGDRGPALENLVCGSDGKRNPMKFSAVSWTSDGARLDGVSSRLWLDDPTGLDFTESYTWMLHLKRAPRSQCFLELSTCSKDGSGIKYHFWEYSFTSGVRRSLFLMPGKPKRFQTASLLPTDPGQFFIAGVSFNRTTSQCKFFLGSDFVPESLQYNTSTNSVYNEAGACIKIGWRSTTSGLLDGTVRTVAVANSALTKHEIRQLFNLP